MASSILPARRNLILTISHLRAIRSAQVCSGISMRGPRRSADLFDKSRKFAKMAKSPKARRFDWLLSVLERPGQRVRHEHAPAARLDRRQHVGAKGIADHH